jgi:hypothetical protein
LLGEPAGEPVRLLLSRAENVVASRLTLLECERSLVRAAAAARLTEADANQSAVALRTAAACWLIVALDEEVAERVGRRFPHEPVRTLDAIHLASALLAQRALPDLALVTLDDHLEANARAMGLTLVPVADHQD